jgi:hypothetical protein
MNEKYKEIELYILDDVLLKLALEAHRLDMKLNDYILLQLTKEFIER